MQIGTVMSLWRYPVKSLAAQAVAQIEVEPGGFAGDRATALIVTDRDHARRGKPYRGKEHALLHTVSTPHAAQSLGAAAGVALTPAHGDHFFDAQPISLLFDRWLRDVEQHVGRTLDPLRYRPNIFACAAADFDRREADLVGSRLELAGVVLDVVAPIGRCVTTTYDVRTGDGDPAVLREVAQRRANIVGVYCTVVRGGPLATGAPIVARFGIAL